MQTKNDKIRLGEWGQNLYLKREDLLDSEISGNKFRKLYYNLEKARQDNYATLLTFGGAFSNHIAAVAAAGRKFGFRTIGVIRGEELAHQPLNPTLAKAQEDGMELHFINRSEFREKNSESFLNSLKLSFGDFYLLPEGGTNALAVQGCEQILSPEDEGFDYICCAVGTGGTLAGISRSAMSHHKVIGIASLKGNFLKDEVFKWSGKDNFVVLDDFCLGGYAKITPEYMEFLEDFERQNKIRLDPVYTGKVLWGIQRLYESEFFKPNDRILAIHTGGLQGWNGFQK